MVSYLLLDIQAPLQSWGKGGPFDVRLTENKPTKAGIVGLLSAALGLRRDQKDEIEELSSKLDIDIFTIDPGSIVTDYHTIGTGYGPDETLFVPRKALALGWLIPKPNEVSPAVTRRQYLQDAHFAVLLETATEEIDQLAAALADPVFFLYFGRKSCPVDISFIVKKFDDKQEATDYIDILKQQHIAVREK